MAQARRSPLVIRAAGGVGPPALAAMALSALGASMLFVLGVVEKHALAVTPLVFLAASLFFVITTMAYVEGNSIHPEQGGASTLARYAFDEFWSFVAGWAILLDYVIVMAIGAVVISEYLSVFWGELGDGAFETAIAAGALAYVAMSNIRGLSANRIGGVLRLSLLSIVVLLLVSLIGLAQYWDPGSIHASIHLGTAPKWKDLIFALGVASVVAIGVEAAS